MATRWPLRLTRRTNLPAWMATTFAFQEFGRVPRICSRVLRSSPVDLFSAKVYGYPRGHGVAQPAFKNREHRRAWRRRVGWMGGVIQGVWAWLGLVLVVPGLAKAYLSDRLHKWQDMSMDMDGEIIRILGLLRSCPGREGLDQQQPRSVRKKKCNFGLIFGWWMLGCVFRVRTASVCLPGIETG